MAEVTIVVPVWDDYVTYLDETLASLVAQSPRPHILLVDNCSEVPLSAPEAQVVSSAMRLSLGAVRSLGLAHVDSEYVVFWDADDIMPPDTLAILSERMQTDPSLSLVATRISEGASRPHHWPRRFTSQLARRQSLFAFISAISSLVPAIGALIRTEHARDAGGFPDLETGDDWVLAVSLAFRGGVDVVDHLGRIYRQHGDSLWVGRQSPAHLFEHAGAVRARIAIDSAAPAWTKRALPLIGLGQWLVIRLLRPLGRLVRS